MADQRGIPRRPIDRQTEVVRRAGDHRLARVTESLPLLKRIGLAWLAWARVLLDRNFAARVRELLHPKQPALAELSAVTTPVSKSVDRPTPDIPDAVFQLLGLLQREGRFLDFIQQDVGTFADAEIGAAARVVHAGCRRVLREHASIVCVRAEPEGATVEVSPSETLLVKLTGNVSGAAPYRGILRHRGWRVVSLKLPERVGSDDPRIVAPAEVEL